uniref:LOW QUALITY PROTEIN: plasmolipin-like n=1 Tax=Gasterosteus aculeatus aculeatus TaxID=481459 RepID=UPI001A989FCA|nr:LOW QUALITY PROTEIN: plasmolipin-like [Gasterosteus aculeatus aculeatus]
MADFPSKVTTETSSPNSRSSQPGGSSLRALAAGLATPLHSSFIRSIRAVLMMAERFLGLIQCSLIASTPYTLLAAFGWVMFVAVTLWILTTILFLLILFGAQQKLTFVPWAHDGMWNAQATVLYLSALPGQRGVRAAWRFTYFYNHMPAAAFFGAVVTIAYGASAFFSYLDWKGDGGNAANTTVPT